MSKQIMIVTSGGSLGTSGEPGEEYRFEKDGALWSGSLPGREGTVLLPESEILQALPAPRSVRYQFIKELKPEGSFLQAPPPGTNDFGVHEWLKKSKERESYYAKRERSARLIFVAFVASVVLVVLVVGVWAVASMRVDARCLRNGYPSTSFAFPWSFYCVKRIDQTDTVVPVEEVGP